VHSSRISFSDLCFAAVSDLCFAAVDRALAASVLATMAIAADRSTRGNREVGTRIGRREG
jgi:hypothetical protein